MSAARLVHIDQLQTGRTRDAIGALLPNGLALLAGGLDHQRIYDPTAQVAEFFLGVPELTQLPTGAASASEVPPSSER